MKPFVSVIMPAYNVGNYIREAIHTIIRQTYKNFELIVVDDGSTDDTIEIVKGFCEADSRIRLVRQEHLFAGEARNKGIDISQGEYLLFLDSDDVFERRMIQELVDIVTRTEADVVLFSYYVFKNNVLLRKKAPIRYSPNENVLVSPLEYSSQLFQITDGLPWTKFIKKELITREGLRYQKLRSSNDEFFNRILVTKARSMVFSRKRFVNYRVGNSTSLQRSRKESSKDYLSAIQAIFNELKKEGAIDKYGGSFSEFALDECIHALSRIHDYTAFIDMFASCQDIMNQIYSICKIPQDNDDLKSKIAYTIIERDVTDCIFCLYKLFQTENPAYQTKEYKIGELILQPLRKIIGAL